jgi:hypothetical protein
MRARLGLAVSLVALCWSQTSNATESLESVSTDSRDVILVANVTHYASEYTWLYDFIEMNAVSVATADLGGSYNKIHMLTGDDATATNFVDGLEALAGRADNKSIDVVINLHGAPGELGFIDAWTNTADLATAIKAKHGLAGHLRAVYSTACFGASHNGDFLSAGFRVASGARGVNTNAAYDYGTVLSAWADGASFGDAQDAGNNSFWISFYDGIASLKMDGTDSFKVVDGNRDTTIDTRLVDTP